jgi:hypothetical protein
MPPCARVSKISGKMPPLYFLIARNFPLLGKRLPAANQNWLLVAHIWCTAGTTLLVFDYP